MNLFEDRSEAKNYLTLLVSGGYERQHSDLIGAVCSGRERETEYSLKVRLATGRFWARSSPSLTYCALGGQLGILPSAGKLIVTVCLHALHSQVLNHFPLFSTLPYMAFLLFLTFWGVGGDWNSVCFLISYARSIQLIGLVILLAIIWLFAQGSNENSIKHKRITKTHTTQREHKKN